MSNESDVIDLIVGDLIRETNIFPNQVERAKELIRERLKMSSGQPQGSLARRSAEEIGRVIGKEELLQDYGETVALMIPEFEKIINAAIAAAYPLQLIRHYERKANNAEIKLAAEREQRKAAEAVIANKWTEEKLGQFAEAIDRESKPQEWTTDDNCLISPLSLSFALNDRGTAGRLKQEINAALDAAYKKGRKDGGDAACSFTKLAKEAK